ncbi:hypothetical protein [Streptomyces sp. WAC 06725]|uniref:hypothetical protein n=1 Tax=Streptomyces sp. WAC 06725 TaxID=2203209 RepID=UPI0026AC0376
MTTVTPAAPRVGVPKRRGAISQSVRDSLTVAKRNLIRMLRIPNRVRPSQLAFTSGTERGNAGEEQTT